MSDKPLDSIRRWLEKVAPPRHAARAPCHAAPHRHAARSRSIQKMTAERFKPKSVFTADFPQTIADLALKSVCRIR